jgi:hypothetical protein
VPEQPQLLASAPGIQRDGTLFAAQAYTDGQWCRFQRGSPRKMRGYISAVTLQPELAYGMKGFVTGGQNYLHVGSESFLKQYVLNPANQLLQAYDRTPASGFVISPLNDWQFDVFFDQPNSLNRIIAHPGQNLADISAVANTSVFFGTVSANAALTDTGSPQVSGGCVALPPYLLTYGNAGQVNWCLAGDLTQWAPTVGAGTVAVTGSKIVKGLSLRGSGTGPAALFWSLDSLIRCTFVGSTGGYFAFDTLSDTISVLSSRGIVAYDGIYYWAGNDRFQVFNGSVSELPNAMNKNWFYDNINMAYRNKVFAFINTRWGEIWWCYPRGTATECSHAVIYNVNEQYWYDTALPSTRTSGEFVKVYENPMLSDATPRNTGDYTIWTHGVGTDAVDGASVLPIDSWFTTAEMSLIRSNADNNLNMVFLEPDFIQSGSMTAQMISRANARGNVNFGPIHAFPPPPATGNIDQTQQVIPMQEEGRLARFRFESNTPGGDYQMGAPYVHVGPSDSRIT